MDWTGSGCVHITAVKSLYNPSLLEYPSVALLGPIALNGVESTPNV